MALVSAENEKYEVQEIIGRGAFGIIRKVRRRNDGQILCRKEISYLKMSTKERDQLQAEFSILSSLRHPNIVGYYHREHIKQTQELYMYMEYCGGGDLGTVIRQLKNDNKLAREDFVWRVLSQTVAALYRCHYGVDPPEPGDSIQTKETRPASSRANSTILHRDLKPENIFLDSEKAVKLGDFGLSKIMSSHDFASTYVGTPFYMSPEICAAEKYTLKSDIWALGCIIYELCTKEPPFNAQTHLQLVNKIRKGDFPPLPRNYSKELGGLIKSCLSTNPMYRPDTETLLNHPNVWLARKQHEFGMLNKSLIAERDAAEHRAQCAEERIRSLETEKEAIRSELDAQIRREWEVKARLEIDRQVELECQQKIDTLRSQFDEEVNRRVQEQLSSHCCNTESRALREIENPPAANSHKDYPNPHSSVNTSAESDWTNTTDLTELSDLSIHSPTNTASKQPPKKTKTPFARSKTCFDSPTDIHMADPSPMSISSLNLSPRRQNADTNQLSGKNLFAKIANNRAKLAIPDDLEEDKENEFDDSDLEDFVPELVPSPTRAKTLSTDPFKMPPPAHTLRSKARPALLQRQHTIATTTKLMTKPNLFPTTGPSNMAAQVRAGITSATTQNPGTQSQIPRSAAETDTRGRPTTTSPTHNTARRRLSQIPNRLDSGMDKIPQEADALMSTSPLRRAGTTAAYGAKLQSKLMSAKNDSNPNVNVVAGRTRVELAQARAGGRPMSSDFGVTPCSPSRKGVNGSGIQIVEKELPPAPIWDPEEYGEDAMPSPFLKRDVKIVQGLR